MRSRLLGRALALAAVAAACAVGRPAASEDWNGICEVKVVECAIMTFEAVREAGGSEAPGVLSAAQVELLWKAVGEKKARLVLSAEVAASVGRRSMWRAGKTHKYLADYNIEGGAVASVTGELALGWTVEVEPRHSFGGGLVVAARVEHASLAGGKAAASTPHGPVETPVLSVRSVSASAKMPVSGVSVLGIMPAGGAGSVQVVLLRTDLPGLKLPRRGGEEIRRRLPSAQLEPKGTFASVKVLEMPDELLDRVRSEVGGGAAGSEISPEQLAMIAEAVGAGKATILEAGALCAFTDHGGEVFAGERRYYLSGYCLVPVRRKSDPKEDAPLMLVDPEPDEVRSGFSLRLSAAGRIVVAPRGSVIVTTTKGRGYVALECTSQIRPLEMRSVDGPHGKVQMPLVELMKVAAPLGHSPRGAYLVGGATGVGEKPELKRVVLVEIESEK